MNEVLYLEIFYFAMRLFFLCWAPHHVLGLQEQGQEVSLLDHIQQNMHQYAILRHVVTHELCTGSYLGYTHVYMCGQSPLGAHQCQG